MKNKVNFAIIGFGSIAKTHAVSAYMANLNYNLSYNLNLKTIVTRSPLESLINGVKNTLNVEEVLEDKEIDFIDICTPNSSHLEIIQKAVGYNKAIYCEKPLASNLKDAKEAEELVRNSHIKNAVALNYRFLPAVRLIRNEIKKGTIGDIIDFKIKLYHKSYLNQNKKASWRTERSSGGGALMDLGVHLIDTVNFTLGEIKEIDSDTRIFFKERTNVDEIANCNLYLQNGVKGSLEVSRIFAEKNEPTTYVVYGTKGSIKMSSSKPYTIEIYDYEEDMTKILGPKGAGEILSYYPSERNSMGFFYDSHGASLVNFANIIKGFEDNGITPTFKDALKAQNIIHRCYNK
ncbi:Gfo/Idh/MocA family protein [Haloimpatiens sp. FM7315]|uniref:Gfo/Idh/MocA family protein n=1 Tax=Haloimpatiens sp. FM7315 TaxID=3298609 RepID=UPI00370B33B5